MEMFSTWEMNLHSKLCHPEEASMCPFPGCPSGAHRTKTPSQWFHHFAVVHSMMVTSFQSLLRFDLTEIRSRQEMLDSGKIYLWVDLYSEKKKHPKSRGQRRFNADFI